MKLSIELETIIKQSLFERYAIEDMSIQPENQKDFIRFSLKGHIRSEPFCGSLNIAKNKDKTYSFTITGWFTNSYRSFMHYVLKDNVYTNSINEIDIFLHSSFGRHITTVLGRFHIGTGDFSFDGKTFTHISINVNPSFRSRLEIAPQEKDKIIDNVLLEYAYVIKDGQSYFTYTTATHSIFNTSVDNKELETFKKMLIREYMTAYSLLTERPNLLNIDEFNTLSYQHIIDYLTVQHMQEIH